MTTCTCLGCNEQTSSGSLCAYHQLLCDMLGITLTDGRFERMYRSGRVIATLIGAGRRPAQIAEVMDGISAKGVERLLQNRFRR